MLKEGDKAPGFELADDAGETFRLADHLGQKLLLVFYPGDDTPVCTRQLCDYRDGIEAFAGLGVTVIGISNDSVESHRKFKHKHSLPFTLLSDPDLAVAERYDSKGMLGVIFRKAQNKISNPSDLHRVIKMIADEDWSGMDVDSQPALAA